MVSNNDFKVNIFRLHYQLHTDKESTDWFDLCLTDKESTDWSDLCLTDKESTDWFDLCLTPILTFCLSYHGASSPTYMIPGFIITVLNTRATGYFSAQALAHFWK